MTSARLSEVIFDYKELIIFHTLCLEMFKFFVISTPPPPELI